MEKMKGGVLAVLVLLVIPLASAGMGWGQGHRGHGIYHEQMEEILETGGYNDLVSMREETGFRIMPWVDSEEDFQYAREMHAAMESGQFHPGFPAAGHGCRMH